MVLLFLNFGFQPAPSSHFGTRTFPEPAFCCSTPRPLGNLYVLSASALSFAGRRPRPLPTTHHSLSTILFRIRTYAKHNSNPFRIHTSKTKDLKPFRIRTYEKTPGGRVVIVLASNATIPFRSARRNRSPRSGAANPGCPLSGVTGYAPRIAEPHSRLPGRLRQLSASG